MTTLPLRLGLFSLFLLAAGCSQPVKTVPARGVIKTNQGQPCEKALIVFHPTEKERINDPKPLAIADSTGAFVVRTFGADDGAIPGEYGVTVVWHSEPSGEKPKISLFGDEEGGRPAGPDRLNGKYGNPKQPLIKLTIPPDGNSNIVLEVEG
jgi:hypothetical protein